MSSNLLDKVHSVINKEDLSKLLLFSGKALIFALVSVISCYLVVMSLVAMVRKMKAIFISEVAAEEDKSNSLSSKLKTLKADASWEHFIPPTGTKAPDKSYLYFNLDETKIIQQEIIEKLALKIKENNASPEAKSTIETNFLIHGKAGNGKSSMVRAIWQYVKSQKKECEVITISTSDIIKSPTMGDAIWNKDSKDGSQCFSSILAEARKKAQANGPNSYIIVNIEEMDTICTEPGMALKILEEFGSVQTGLNSHIIFVATTNDLGKLLNVREHSGQKSIVGGAYDDAVTNWSQNLNEETAARRQSRAQYDTTTQEKLKQEAKLRADKIASIKRRVKFIEITFPDSFCIEEILQDKLNIQDEHKKKAVIEGLIPVLLGYAKDFIITDVVKLINKQDQSLNSEVIIAKIKEQSYYGDREQNLTDMIGKATEQLQQCEKGKELVKNFMKEKQVGGRAAKKLTYKLLTEFLSSQESENASSPQGPANEEFSRIIDNLSALVAAKEALPAAQQSKPKYEFSMEDELIEVEPRQPSSRINNAAVQQLLWPLLL